MELLNLYLGNALIFDFFIILFSAALLVHLVFKSKFKSSLFAGIVLAVLLSAWEYTQEFILHDFGFMFWLVLIAFWAYGSFKLLQQKGATKGIVFLISTLYFLFYLFLYPDMRGTVDESFQTILFWAFIVDIVILVYLIIAFFKKEKYFSAISGVGSSLKKASETISIKLKERHGRIQDERKIKEEEEKRKAEKKRKEVEENYNKLFAELDRRQEKASGVVELEKLEKLRKRLEQRKNWALGDIDKETYRNLRGIKSSAEIKLEEEKKKADERFREMEKLQKQHSREEEKNKIAFSYFKGLSNEIKKRIDARRSLEEIGRLYKDLEEKGRMLLKTDYRVDVDQETKRLNRLIHDYRVTSNSDFRIFSDLVEKASSKIKNLEDKDQIQKLIDQLKDKLKYFSGMEYERKSRNLFDNLEKEFKAYELDLRQLKDNFKRFVDEANDLLSLIDKKKLNPSELRIKYNNLVREFKKYHKNTFNERKCERILDDLTKQGGRYESELKEIDSNFLKFSREANNILDAIRKKAEEPLDIKRKIDDLIKYGNFFKDTIKENNFISVVNDLTRRVDGYEKEFEKEKDLYIYFKQGVDNTLGFIRRKVNFRTIEDNARRLSEIANKLANTIYRRKVIVKWNELESERSKYFKLINDLKLRYNILRKDINNWHIRMVAEKKSTGIRGKAYDRWKLRLDEIDRLRKESKKYGIEL